MPTVRAKMYVASVSRYAYNADSVQVKLQAVTRGDENKQWAAATPVAEFTLSINNKAASDMLAERLGQEFYVDISPVDDDS